MAFYRQVGEVPPKRHTQFRRPDGGLYSEELVGEEGFSSDSALVYHRGIPSAIVDARPWQLPDQDAHAERAAVPAGTLKLHDLFPAWENKGRSTRSPGRRLCSGKRPTWRIS
jgi:homogentisate 1,2-dioxygenase